MRVTFECGVSKAISGVVQAKVPIQATFGEIPTAFHKLLGSNAKKGALCTRAMQRVKHSELRFSDNLQMLTNAVCRVKVSWC